MARELIKSNMLEGGGGGESFSLGKWNFETATGTPPSSNSIRLNNSTPASATKLYIHDIDNQSTNYGSKLSGLPSGSIIYIFVDDTTNFQITISAVTDQSTYVEFDISDIIVEGTISNGAEVSVSVDVGGEQVDLLSVSIIAGTPDTLTLDIESNREKIYTYSASADHDIVLQNIANLNIAHIHAKLSNTVVIGFQLPASTFIIATESQPAGVSWDDVNDQLTIEAGTDDRFELSITRVLDTDNYLKLEIGGPYV